MQTIEEIVVAAQKATEASLREAYDAGRARTASDLKSRMAAFFEGMIAEVAAQPAPAPAAPPSEDHHPDDPHE